MTQVTLSAPCRGWLSALDSVPDPVFADRMLGDGFAIDPLDNLICAPCDATVIAIAPSAHSVTLGLANGAQVIIHVGLETVALDGRGFTPRVEIGAAVSGGAVLLELDLNLIAAAGKNLITPVVVVSDGFEITRVAIAGLVDRGAPIIMISPSTPTHAIASGGGETASRDLVIPLPHGIHARPAARIVAALRGLEAEVSVARGERTANARSTVALMALGARLGDTITLNARGNDAEAAISLIARLIESGMGETAEPAPHATPPVAPVGQSGPLFHGVRASPGLAIGAIHILHQARFDIPRHGRGSEAERTAFDAALARVRDRLGQASGPIALAHLGILDDPDLAGTAFDEIERGASAAQAWHVAIERASAAITATGDQRLIERIADLVDVETQILRVLLPDAATAPEAIPPGSIVVAEEILPSQFLDLSRAHIAGIATARGGPTSHTAILAAAAGIPMIVALGEQLLALHPGQDALLDAEAAMLDTAPTEGARAKMQDRLVAAAAARQAHHEMAHQHCRTADGMRIEVFANLGSVADAETAVAQGAEGCGLLRTEFLFLERETAPAEAEQRTVYAAIAAALDGRPLIVRTLDIGGDKPVPYLPATQEDNPALGARGIRLGLAQPDMLATQLRAIIAAVPGSQCRIMLPMIVDRDELRTVRSLVDAAARDVGCPGRIALGVMIETPAAAVLADTLAEEADFVSIGTNDLTQYALAADRGNPAVAARVDAFHPAVLRLISMTATGAAGHGKWTGVCGSLASDPAATPLLIGLGVTELSVAPNAVAAIKARVRQFTIEQCRDLATRALHCATVHEVRALLEGL